MSSLLIMNGQSRQTKKTFNKKKSTSMINKWEKNDTGGNSNKIGNRRELSISQESHQNIKQEESE